MESSKQMNGRWLIYDNLQESFRNLWGIIYFIINRLFHYVSNGIEYVYLTGLRPPGCVCDHICNEFRRIRLYSRFLFCVQEYRSGTLTESSTFVSRWNFSARSIATFACVNLLDNSPQNKEYATSTLQILAFDCSVCAAECDSFSDNVLLTRCKYDFKANRGSIVKKVVTCFMLYPHIKELFPTYVFKWSFFVLLTFPELWFAWDVSPWSYFPRAN